MAGVTQAIVSGDRNVSDSMQLGTTQNSARHNSITPVPPVVSALTLTFVTVPSTR